jgi:hypothetical protein
VGLVKQYLSPGIEACGITRITRIRIVEAAVPAALVGASGMPAAKNQLNATGFFAASTIFSKPDRRAADHGSPSTRPNAV